MFKGILYTGLDSRCKRTEKKNQNSWQGLLG